MKVTCTPGDNLRVVCTDEKGRPLNTGVEVIFGEEFLEIYVHAPKRCKAGDCDKPVVKMKNKAYKPNVPSGTADPFLDALEAAGFKVLKMDLNDLLDDKPEPKQDIKLN